ncbi:MAG: hypothetical protein ACFN0W_06495 [Propionibacterium acidifaciens]|uniref:hypothetical protein n=1 Tax=Propionibacterium acidifaciens TaxID=556499 RepID=UPI00360EBD9F
MITVADFVHPEAPMKAKHFSGASRVALYAALATLAIAIFQIILSLVRDVDWILLIVSVGMIGCETLFIRELNDSNNNKDSELK